jgi:transcriptional regulator with XRE-family HTH domain
MTRSRDEELSKAFASVLRDLREQSGFTQEQLAHVAGVDRTFVGRLESGKRQPSLAVVFAIAQALDQTPQRVIEMVYRCWKQAADR